MEPLKALKGHIKNLTYFELHILLTKEDGVIVARCLDFSVSSHGNDEKEALASLTDSVKDYLNYAIEQHAFNDIMDPDEDRFWEIYRKLELENNWIAFLKMANTLKTGNIEEVAYA